MSPKGGAASPDAGSPLGFHSPFQRCGDKCCSRPNWAWLDYLEFSKSRTAHRKCIRLKPRQQRCAENLILRPISVGTGCQETVTFKKQHSLLVSLELLQSLLPRLTYHLAKIALPRRGCRKSQFGGMRGTCRCGEV